MNGDDYLRVRDVAAELDVHPRTVRLWITKGQLPAVRVGGEWRIPRSWLEMKLEADTAKAVKG